MPLAAACVQAMGLDAVALGLKAHDWTFDLAAPVALVWHQEGGSNSTSSARTISSLVPAFSRTTTVTTP